MIKNPQTLTEQLLNLVERIATEMKALFATIKTKQDAGDYATNTALTSGLAGKANTAHSHEISAVNGLQTALDGKQAVGDYLTKNTADGYYLGKTEKAASAGSADTATKATQDASGNTITETYATKTELADKQPVGDYLTTSAASTAYAAKSHSHTTAEVTGLDTALAGKANTAHSHNQSDVAGLDTTLADKVDLETYTADKATFLTKTDASNTYLGKTDKAESAKVADSATTATNNILKSGARGILAGSETVNVLSGNQTITKDSADTIVMNTTGAVTLTFTPAGTNDCAVKVIALTATGETTLNISGAVWANLGEAPTWGTAGKHLVLVAHFINNRVILCIFDNDES